MGQVWEIFRPRSNTFALDRVHPPSFENMFAWMGLDLDQQQWLASIAEATMSTMYVAKYTDKTNMAKNIALRSIVGKTIARATSSNRTNQIRAYLL
jgi:hypothetical protein